MGHSPIRLHPIHQCAPRVLQRDRIPMVVVHLRQHIDRVGIEGQVRRVDDAEGVELVPKSTLAKNELGGVRSVKTIDAVGATDAVLEGDGRAIVLGVAAEIKRRRVRRRGRIGGGDEKKPQRSATRTPDARNHSLQLRLDIVRIRLRARMEEPRQLDGLLSDIFEVADHVLRLPTPFWSGSAPVSDSLSNGEKRTLCMPDSYPKPCTPSSCHEEGSG